MAYLLLHYVWDIVWGNHEKLWGFEQLGWKIHILDCFFTYVSGTLVGIVKRLALAGTLGQSGLSSMETSV